MIKQLKLKEFTKFADATFDFASGINVVNWHKWYG